MPRPLPAAVLAITENDLDAVRNHIMEASWRIIQRHGLAAASTRTIAEEAGVSGGTLYNYFDNHRQLLAKSIVNHGKNLADPVADFASRAGKGTVAGNLEYFVRQAATVLDQLVPPLAAAFSDHDLVDAVRREIADVDPLRDPAGVVTRYLLAERELGRVSRTADCRAAASIVTSICHDDAFQRYLYRDDDNHKSRVKEIALIARSLAD